MTRKRTRSSRLPPRFPPEVPFSLHFKHLHERQKRPSPACLKNRHSLPEGAGGAQGVSREGEGGGRGSNGMRLPKKNPARGGGCWRERGGELEYTGIATAENDGHDPDGKTTPENQRFNKIYHKTASEYFRFICKTPPFPETPTRLRWRVR